MMTIAKTLSKMGLVIRGDDLIDDRRQHSRQPYPQRQWLNACPEADDGLAAWREVRCHDLSAEGFSFWYSAAPQSSHLVLSLGESGTEVDVLAEVKHTTEVSCLQDHLYLVGCQILRRSA